MGIKNKNMHTVYDRKAEKNPIIQSNPPISEKKIN